MKKNTLKENSKKIPLKERRKLERIKLFEKYILDKRLYFKNNKYLTFN